MAEKTKICCLDVEKDVLNYLKEEHDVYRGSLGVKVRLPETRSSGVRVLPNYNFPVNIQEYDVFVVDLSEGVSIDYLKDDYIPQDSEIGENLQIVCSGGVHLFNPIPYGAFSFFKAIHVKKDKRPIIIVFHDEYIQRHYIWCDKDGYRHGEEQVYSNYNFARMPEIRNMYGTQVSLADNAASEMLFKDRLQDIHYHCVFDYIDNGDYIPLVLNRNKECVSFIKNGRDSIIITLPQMADKASFLKHLFDDFLYETFSDYFPAVEEKRWIHNPEYLLPNESEMLDELERLEIEYEDKKRAVAQRMVENADKYSFLHTLITGTGADLVQATIQYLKWLGFKNVIDKDPTAGDVLEEDIQVDLGDRGLLVVEVKGLYGTSKDSECSQIEKIKHRRERERNSLDVYALYIVNHQRGIEPLKRTNPPFLPKQITDAEDDRRGLVTTWQLYNLYYDIERGVICKEDARASLLQYGLVKFLPSQATLSGEPYDYKSNNIICLELKNQPINIGDELFAFDGSQWKKAEILSIQENHQDIPSISTGRVGVRLNAPLPKKQEVYVRHRVE